MDLGIARNVGEACPTILHFNSCVSGQEAPTISAILTVI